MLTFLSPLFLIGMASAAVPLLVHLSRSRRIKRMPFSTTRFFTDQFLRSYRMSRLKELWLLAARMALFALFAMALAQPVLMPRGRTLFSGRRCAVLVVDDSASMGYTEDGATLFDHARAAGLELLANLKPGDLASVVLAGRRADGPAVLFPRPVSALSDVKAALSGIAVSSLGTDLSAAVRRAEDIARASGARSREVYVLSDLQSSGWDASSALPPASESDVLFFFVSVRPKKPGNLGITAVQYGAVRPAVGVPFSLRAHIRRQGERIAPAEVSLYVDGERISQQALDELQPGRWATPLFHCTFPKPGWHSGHIEVTDEDFMADNRRYFAFDVAESFRVLAVNGDPSQIAARDELFFLRKALAAGGDGKAGVQVREMAPRDIESADLNGYSVVVLANVPSVSDTAAEKIEQYVDGGGALWVFAGSRTDADAYRRNLGSARRLHGGLLPGRLDRIVGNPGGGTDYAAVGYVDRENPALAAFHDPRFASLAGVTFRALWHVEPLESAVLMTASTGDPILCEKPFGKGRVMLCAAPCDRDWSNFPVKPAFLPWVHRIVAYLGQRPMGRVPFYTTGQTVHIPASRAGGAISVRRPDGSVVPTEEAADTPGAVAFSGTTEPGVYAVIRSGGASAGSPEDLFVVNIEGAESDLSYLDEAPSGDRSAAWMASAQTRTERALRNLFPGRPLIHYVGSPSGIAEAADNARRGIKLWDMALIAVLLLALIEPWAANRISLRHYVGPAGQPVDEVARRSRMPTAMGTVEADRR